METAGGEGGRGRRCGGNRNTDFVGRVVPGNVGKGKAGSIGMELWPQGRGLAGGRAVCVGRAGR